MRFGLGVSVLALLVAVPSLAAEKPELGTFGFDVAGMDRGVKPGDDFYQFANGAYLKALEIPADKSSFGMFHKLDDLSRERTRVIIEEAAASGGAPGTLGGTAARKVGDYFAGFMDEAAIEAKGLAPVQPYLDAIAKVDGPAGISRIIGQATRMGMSVPVGIGIQTDDKNPDVMVVSLSQSGLGLPDRDYYLDKDQPELAKAREAYLVWAKAMLELTGATDAGPRAAAVMALETKMATAHWTVVESRDADKTYNDVPRATLVSGYAGYDWAALLGAAGIEGADRVLVAQPSALQGMGKLIASEPLAVWKDYLTLRQMAAAAPYLPKRVVDTNFALVKALSGTPQLRDRWKRGVDNTSAMLGDAVAQIYVARHFPPEAKAKADELVKNIIVAMDARLANLEWMAPATRASAREKLKAFTPKIGYPDKWRDYSKFEVVRGDALGNAMRGIDFEHEREVAKLGKPVDRSEWFLTPMTVNAYAYPVWNEIVFPAAILQAPFFDANADAAVNYGAIGAVIGHEITHHFDDQGRKYDKTGKLAEWWTPEDVTRFEGLTNKVVAQYGAYEPLPGKKINGELTLGENIADLAGLVIAKDAYARSLDGKAAPVIDGFSGDQRFFLGFAQVWRAKYRDQVLLQQLVSDPHSPSSFRPFVVRNLDAWYSAFDVKAGDKLYLAPDARLRVW
ncbi:zinc metalloprotease [Polymorphobacter multimanifer]|uniref:Putative endopeptidase n=1 Tax=Polymorphobacter multimanifer TaxID=1070431 RepID=A0A841L892_9SPHN|nr:M13-type metalloendopeptidase [Polymorphobacter multimanifer]MBB6226075.1 putative endopeptidase [Polymorphobacter multimanifer]GGI92804.1 zinc metalloprotease [Polymorphobacter multimanifer]